MLLLGLYLYVCVLAFFDCVDVYYMIACLGLVLVDDCIACLGCVVWWSLWV